MLFYQVTSSIFPQTVEQWIGRWYWYLFWRIQSDEIAAASTYVQETNSKFSDELFANTTLRWWCKNESKSHTAMKNRSVDNNQPSLVPSVLVIFLRLLLRGSSFSGRCLVSSFSLSTLVSSFLLIYSNRSVSIKLYHILMSPYSEYRTLSFT